ncbi:hypothetical protein GYH30_014224 [Glycine max]|uniref:Peptidase M1 alanyl aminopeptidase C-terminal domain-containing protein n=1 Tax=Glycine max TaxID=3847 RepID=A0A0R0JKG8_SOYBN|nr:hypothetical protein GYH30_014224 [Glycine max]
MAIKFLMFVSPICVHLFSLILEVLPTYNFILLLPFQVVNKWFALQTMSDISGNVENVRKLLSHSTFDLRNLMLLNWFICLVITQFDQQTEALQRLSGSLQVS